MGTELPNQVDGPADRPPPPEFQPPPWPRQAEAVGWAPPLWAPNPPLDTNLPANWYPDPSAPQRLRYWDGVQWTQHVSVAPAPVSYTVHPRLLYAPTKRMAIASIATVGCVVLLQLLSAVFVWSANRAVENEITTYDVVNQLELWLYLAAYIVTCLWLSDVRRNAEALNPIARHVRGRGWVWGSWVCPVVSLWFPFQIVRDVQAATNPQGRRTALIGWWWAACLPLNFMWEGLNVLGLIWSGAYSLSGGREVIGLLLSLAAGTLWAAIVLRIERNQAALLAGR
jgi:hypothetical protein